MTEPKADPIAASAASSIGQLDPDASVELERLLSFCSAPRTDTLLRIESEGGQWWEFDAKQFRLAVLALVEGASGPQK